MYFTKVNKSENDDFASVHTDAISGVLQKKN